MSRTHPQRRSQTMRRLMTLAAGAGWSVLVFTQDALASGADVGENTGRLMWHWAQWLYIGIAAVAAAAYLPGRRREDAIGFLIIAIVLGGFVWAPQTVGGVITDIWQKVAA